MKNENLPTWKGIYSFFGLNNDVSVAFPSENVSVHFIDVGQGDSELIITPEYNILIDSGENENYTKVLNYLDSYNIDTLHYIIVTHPHSDHAGGMSYIIDEVTVKKIIMPDIKDEIIPTTSTYRRLISSIEKNNTEVIFANENLSFDLGDNTFIDILAPLKDYDDLNNYSVVFKLTHGVNTFLFTGDIEKESENDILDNNTNVSARVLKVAHHGSSTSSKKSFLKAVGGEFAVIEVGAPNSYNHPNENTVKNLISQGYTIYRTDRNGNIVFVSDGESLEIITEKGTAQTELEE